MLQEFLPIAVLIVLAAILAVLVLLLGVLFGPHRPTKRKSEPYESGMAPYGPGSRRMSVRYYLVGVLFILFDVEVVFFLPWAVVFRQLKIFGLIEMFVFVLILLAGYIYAWKEGAFEWE
jgi:NADH-quinone oxidoreductase subunit A